MIHKEDIDKIFEAVRVEEVVADYVTLKKRGANLIGLCPFHDEKTPSFYVSPAKGIYKCFGCGKGGHAVNFVMEKELFSYPEALRQLAKKYNIDIVEEEQTPEQLQSQNDRESLFVVSSFAQKTFTDNLHTTDEGKSVGLGYFKERGFRDDIIEKFQLGFNLNDRNAFTNFALKEGYKQEYLVKSGLAFEYKNENKPDLPAKLLDRFWGRIMFPIHNATGRVIAFGGRTLRTDKKTAKYINSPETDIYHKSDVLYGIYFAKKELIHQDNCYLVEGYTDVIAMHQAGIENVVASSGTSLTVGQIKLIRRFTKNITILYDGDSAGIKASFRGIDLILEEGMNVKVLLFPDGEDPDSFSKRVSSEELKAFIKDNSKDFISFKTNLLMGDVENDPIKKAELIKDIVQSIALIPEAIYRSVYVKECCRILDIDEQTLLNELNKIRNIKFNEKRNRPAQSAPTDTVNAPSVVEKEKKDKVYRAEYQERKIVELLINHGAKNIMVDSEDEEGEQIQVETNVAHLVIAELQHDEIVLDNKLYNTIYNVFVQHHEKGALPDEKYFLYHEDFEISSLTVDLTSSQYELSDWERHSIYTTMEEDNIKKSTLQYIYTLKSRRLEIMSDDIDKQMKESSSDEDIIILQQTKAELLKAKVSINKFLGRILVK